MAVGTAIIDFGTGNQNAEVTVTLQTNLLAGSKVEPYVMADTSADYNEDSHLLMQSCTIFSVPVSRIVPGVSFVIVAFSDQMLTGRFIINWVGNYT